MLESCLAVFIIAVITMSLTDYVESNAKTLNLRTDAELLVNLENGLRQYILANPDKMSSDPKNPQPIEIKIEDIRHQGFLGIYHSSKFYDAVRIYSKPQYSTPTSSNSKDPKSYFYGTNYLIVYQPFQNGTMGNEYNAIGRGNLINFVGPKAGVYSKADNKVHGLTDSWQVDIKDFDKDEDTKDPDVKARQIYLHDVIPMTQKQSEIISLDCFDPRANARCSPKNVIQFSCTTSKDTRLQKLFFTYSGHDVDELSLDDVQNNLPKYNPEYGRGVFELDLSKFCATAKTSFQFQPRLTPLLNNNPGAPFIYKDVLNLEIKN